MKTFILFPSAFEFWMHVDSKEKFLKADFDEAECGFDKAVADYLTETFQLSKPLHIAVRGDMNRRGSDEYVCHVLSKDIPAGSFVKVANDIYVCCPELCFLLACSKCSLAECVKIANDLCSLYYIDSSAKYGLTRRKALTDTYLISKHLERAGSTRGIHLAKIAIKYSVENSFSPFESKIAAIGILPVRYGGFGLPKPQLNYEVKLSASGSRHLGRSSCCCDFVWPKQRVIMEYDSKLTHLEADQHSYDKGKATALNESGYLLIAATEKQFQNYISMCNLFLMLRRNLKMKNHRKRFSKTNELRYQVFIQLFRSKKSYMDFKTQTDVIIN